mgnify:CR=1 FL=1
MKYLKTIVAILVISLINLTIISCKDAKKENTQDNIVHSEMNHNKMNKSNNMMDENKFNTFVPLQTLSADHLKFKPDGGYWRGPTWLDQAYFGVIGMRNYGYIEEAELLSNKLMHNADGVMEKGISIRENYNPITGEGLESENFSWSAAHYLLLMLKK